MSDYRSRVGHDFALASLTRLSPQPASAGLQYTRRVRYGDGSAQDFGPYVEWVWSVVEDAAQLGTILTPLGLHNATSSPVTIYTRDDLYVYHRYNGVAQRPQANWDNYFPRNITVLITSLEFLA